MKILVTGGTGYIGSHTVVELLKSGHEPIIADNLVNSSEIVLKRIKKITGVEPAFINLDISEYVKLRELFLEHTFGAVIHFSALKAVNESVKLPLLYYKNNLSGLLSVVQCMEEFSVPKIIFSSSATVYGLPEEVPLNENGRTGIGITNPYGQTKVMCEQILTDCAKANQDLQVTLLRYFNPIGAHESGVIGEDPNGPPNNLVPYISQVAVGRRNVLNIYGNDYDTPDGTGVRDYIHVVDLAKGHLAALSHTPRSGEVDIYNLGTGKGYSVLEIVDTFEQASGVTIPYEFVPRREGDVATCYSDPTLAFQELGWKAQKNLKQMCEDTWRWQSQNPKGYSNQ